MDSGFAVAALCTAPDAEPTSSRKKALDRYPLTMSDLEAEVSSRLWRNLTLEEWRQYLPGQTYSKTCPTLP